MLDKLRDTFNKWISEKSEEERILITLRIKCDFVVNKSRQSFCLYHEGDEEQSVWMGFNEGHTEEDFLKYFEWQYSQI